MPQVFGGFDEHGQPDESRRRRSVLTGTVATAAVPAVSPLQQNPPAAPAKKTPAAPAVIDRLHKKAISEYGGYIYVGHDHGPWDTDQVPPLNPGYLYQAKASSINDAYQEAIWALPKLAHPGARIGIVILGGVWYETLVVDYAGIDFFGSPRATIAGQVTLLPPKPTKMFPMPHADTLFQDLEFLSLLAGEGSAPNPVGGMMIPVLPDTDPTTVPVRFRGCKFMSDGVAMFAQSRFHATDCHWIRTGGQLTDTILTYDETNIPLVIQLTGMEQGETLIERSKIEARTRAQTGYYSAPGVWQPLDNVPLGYALHVSGGSNVTLADPPNSQTLWPHSSVQIEQSDVLGSLLNDQARVNHRFCDLHGGVPDIAADEGGPPLVYEVMRGEPLFNEPLVGYFGDRLALSSIDSCDIHSSLVALPMKWNGGYPPGIDPATYPGKSDIIVTNCTHFRRYDYATVSAFGTGGGTGIATVINSATGSSAWTSTGFTATTYGSCPVAVPLKSFYLM